MEGRTWKEGRYDKGRKEGRKQKITERRKIMEGRNV